MTPALALPHRLNRTARTTWAPGCGVAPRKAVDLALDRASQQPVPRRIKLDLDRCGCRSGRACAGSAGCARRVGRARAPRRSPPPRRSRGRGRCPSPPPRARAPSRSARSTSNRFSGCSGGGWLRTSRAGSVTSVVAISSPSCDTRESRFTMVVNPDSRRNPRCPRSECRVRPRLAVCSATRSVASWVPPSSRRESWARRKNSGASCSQVAPMPPCTLIIERAAKSSALPGYRACGARRQRELLRLGLSRPARVVLQAASILRAGAGPRSARA